jgi:hypothetical protein
VEVRLSEEPAPGGGWSCAVRLRVEYDEASGARLAQPQELAFQEGILEPLQVGPARAGTWAAQGRAGQPALLRLLLRPGQAGRPGAAPLLQVERAVRAAQASLLAPPPDAVGPAAGEPLMFSRNVVVLEVRGAPVNLTLIDLPGIIQNVERPQDAPYRALVAQLLRDYVSRDNAIIVATVSCKEDIETQVGGAGGGERWGQGQGAAQGPARSWRRQTAADPAPARPHRGSCPWRAR